MPEVSLSASLASSPLISVFSFSVKSDKFWAAVFRVGGPLRLRGGCDPPSLAGAVTYYVLL